MLITRVQHSMRNNLSSTAWVLLAAAVGTGTLLAGCGAGETEVSPADSQPESSDEEQDNDSEETDDQTAAEAELTIVITIDPDAEELPEADYEPAEWTLTCAPAGGDHPDPEAACAELAELDLEVFEPVSGDTSCTMIYGGPVLASVTGQIDGTEVDAEFDRSDGCEIHRWDEMGQMLEP